MSMEFEALINVALTSKYHHITFVNDYEDGRWREEKLKNFIGDSLIHTALSEKERSSLIADLKIETMRNEALKKLRKSQTKNGAEGSELGEICLYGIMKNHYKALPIVPKIFYKQNSNDYAKGADSVHLVLSEGDFEIWLGESKFYNNLDRALSIALDSVENMLGTEKLKKENSIITNLPDLKDFENDELTDDIRRNIYKVLSFESSIDELKKRLHVPIFILHECNITKQSTSLEMCKCNLTEIHVNKVKDYKSKLEDRLSGIYNFNEISFHIILFPIPEKEPIRKWFIEEFVGTN